jgi:hypothetical protein
MKFKGTWGLLLIFITLIAFLYFFDIPNEKRQNEQKEKAEKLFDFSTDLVQQAELISTKGHFLIQKNSEGKWMVKNILPRESDSLNVLADSNVVERIIQEIQELKSGRVVDEKGEDLKSFGFNAQEKSVTLKLKNSSSLQLLIGDEAPLSETVYVKMGDSPKVYLTGSGIKTVVENDFWKLRNKHLLSYDQILIDRVEVKTPNQSWDLNKKGDEWFFNDRPADKVNEEKLSSFLFSAGTLDGESVLSEEGKNLKEFGLDPPYATLRFHIKDKVHALLIGKMKKEDMVTAIGNPAGPIFAIKKEFLNRISAREELIKKEPSPIPATSSNSNKTK